MKILAAIVIILSISGIFSESTETQAEYICTTEDRNKTCSTLEVSDQKSYCGWFDTTIQCIRAPCAMDYTSQCEACKEKTVAKVTAGKCEDKNENTSTSISTYKCKTEDRGVMCTEEYIGVCAVKNKNSCTDKDCYYNTGTNCQACTNTNVETVYGKECENINFGSIGNTIKDTYEAQNCIAADRNKTCTEEWKGICAFKYCENDSKKVCKVEKGTVCQACQDIDIKYAVDEKCDTIDQKVINVLCKPEERGATCNVVTPHPVCGVKNNCVGDCTQNYLSACSACSDSNIKFYVEGECGGTGTFLNSSFLVMTWFILSIIAFTY